MYKTVGWGEGIRNSRVGGSRDRTQKSSLGGLRVYKPVAGPYAGFLKGGLHFSVFGLEFHFVCMATYLICILHY